jgi:hypothetical protein
MAKVADVKLTWVKSPSLDVAKQKVITTVDGTVTEIELAPVAEELMIVVQANSSVQFRIETFDAEGNVATSETHSFTLGDLEAPLPATDLGHEVVAVRDEEPVRTAKKS